MICDKNKCLRGVILHRQLRSGNRYFWFRCNHSSEYIGQIVGSCLHKHTRKNIVFAIYMQYMQLQNYVFWERKADLTHFSLVTSYTVGDLAVWRHQAIIRANVDFQSISHSSIRYKAMCAWKNEIWIPRAFEITATCPNERRIKIADNDKDTCIFCYIGSILWGRDSMCVGRDLCSDIYRQSALVTLLIASLKFTFKLAFQLNSLI